MALGRMPTFAKAAAIAKSLLLNNTSIHAEYFVGLSRLPLNCNPTLNSNS